MPLRESARLWEGVTTGGVVSGGSKVEEGGRGGVAQGLIKGAHIGSGTRWVVEEMVGERDQESRRWVEDRDFEGKAACGRKGSGPTGSGKRPLWSGRERRCPRGGVCQGSGCIQMWSAGEAIGRGREDTRGEEHVRNWGRVGIGVTRGEWLAGGGNQGRRDRVSIRRGVGGGRDESGPGGGKRQGRRDRGYSPTWGGGEGERILAETSFRRGVGGGAIGTGGGGEPMSREKGKRGRISVSYTHLDVYKRQDNPLFPRIPTWSGGEARDAVGRGVGGRRSGEGEKILATGACRDRDYEGRVACGRKKSRPTGSGEHPTWSGRGSDWDGGSRTGEQGEGEAGTNLGPGGKRRGCRDRGCSPTWSVGEAIRRGREDTHGEGRVGTNMGQGERGKDVGNGDAVRRGVGGRRSGEGEKTQEHPTWSGRGRDRDGGEEKAGGERGGDVGIGDKQSKLEWGRGDREREGRNSRGRICQESGGASGDFEGRVSCGRKNQGRRDGVSVRRGVGRETIEKRVEDARGEGGEDRRDRGEGGDEGSEEKFGREEGKGKDGTWLCSSTCQSSLL
ncbi:hypothetical protein CBR_g44319 [Chara braunii]|uniref:Uncharacterized protein n=1 Tax=Chara braunii TaxID=69332 RepID=A0A388K2Y9_CHABU|nr:hypothetical protein CBR_g44319 [Chara braunii]|eukprot:GBG64434.1 hypothetical protein CBR_g44319 [Chara braunii]